MSFVLFASPILFVSYAAAQDIGTVKNSDGTTTTTVRDTRYGPDGVKSTTTYPNRRIEEQWFGGRDANGRRRSFETKVTYYPADGTKTETTETFRGSENIMDIITWKEVKTDVLGGVISIKTETYDEHRQVTKGTEISVDSTGKKTTKEYDPKTKTYKDVESAKTEEPKKEPEKKEEPRKKRPSEDTGFKLFGGVSYMRTPEETKNLTGFDFSLFYKFTRHVGVGGEVAGAFGRSNRHDISLHRYTILGGPQFNFNANDRVEIFIHGLFGVDHDTNKTTFGTTSVSSSGNAFAMNFGSGFDVKINKHFAVRPFQFDEMLTHFGQWQSNYRVSAGVVINFKNYRFRP